MIPPVQPIPANAALFTGGATRPQSLLDPALPAVLPPTQVLANAHLLRSQHGWSQADVDAYVRDESGLPTMVDLASQIAAPKPGEDAPSALTAGVSAFGRGASFNFADRLAGILNAIEGDTPSPTLRGRLQDVAQNYLSGRDQARQFYGAADLAHPALDRFFSALGNVGTTVAGGAALQAPTSILQGAGQGALIGGGSAGATTLGAQPDLTDPNAWLNAGKAAGVGAAVGAPLGAAGTFLARQLFGNAGKLATDAVKTGGGEDALRQAEAELRSNLPAGTPMVPADLSPSLRNLATTAARQATPDVAEPLAADLAIRTAGQPQRIATGLKDLLGGGELDTPARVSQLTQIVRDIGNDPETGYQALNDAVGPISDPRLDELLSRPAIGSAYARAVQSLQNTGIPEAEAGVPTFQTLHATLQTLGDDANELIARGGKAGFTGHALQQAAEDLRHVIADNVPAFEDLQSRYTAAKDLLDAANDAGTVASHSLSDLRSHVAELSPEQLPEFRRALASKVYDQLQSMRTSRSVAGTLLEDPAFADKMKLAFGDLDTYQRFMDRVDAEQTLQQTSAIFPKRGPIGASPEMGQQLPVSMGFSFHGEGMPRPYAFVHNLRAGSATTANPLTQALLTPRSVEAFLQTIERLNGRGLPLSRALTALPGLGASQLTQP